MATLEEMRARAAASSGQPAAAPAAEPAHDLNQVFPGGGGPGPGMLAPISDITAPFTGSSEPGSFRDHLETYGIVPMAMLAAETVVPESLVLAPAAKLVVKSIASMIGGILGQTGVEAGRAVTEGETRPGAVRRIEGAAAAGAASPGVSRGISRGFDAFVPAPIAAKQQALDRALTRLHNNVDDELARASLQPNVIRAESEKTTREQAVQMQRDALAATMGDDRASRLAIRGEIEGSLPAATVEREKVRGTLQQLYGRLQKSLGSRYDALETQATMQTPLDGEAMDNMRSELTAIGTPPEFQRVKGAARARIQSFAQRLQDPAIEQARTNILAQVPNLQAKDPARFDQLVAMQADALRKIPGAVSRPPVTVGDVLQFKRDMAPYLDDTMGATRGAARLAQRSALDALAPHLPMDPQLNADYGVFRSRFPSQAVRELHQGELPTDFKRFFEGPQLGLLLNHANPVDRRNLQGMVTDYIVNKGIKIDKIVGDGALMSPETFRRLYGDAESARLLTLRAKTDPFAELIGSNPAIRQVYQESLQRGADAAWKDVTKAVHGHLQTFAKDIGHPQLARELTDMDAARATEVYFRDFPLGQRQQHRLLPDMTGERSMIDLSPDQMKRAVGLGGMEALFGRVGPYIKSALGLTAVGSVRRGMQRLWIASMDSPRYAALLGRLTQGPITLAHVKMLGKLVGRLAVADGMQYLGQPGDGNQVAPPSPSPIPRGQRQAAAQAALAGQIQRGEAPSAGAIRSQANDPRADLTAEERRRLRQALPPAPLPAAPAVR